jgi:transcriptional regulator with XRE-family HTH domain
MADSPKAHVLGDVVAVRAPASAELELGLVASVSPFEIEVIAISEETKYATDDDVILPADFLGFAAVVHQQVRRLVLPEQLDVLLGSLEDAENLANGTTTLETGPPVLSEADPRLSLRAELVERWAPYCEPVESLRSTRTFGELLAKRRSAAGLERDGLAAVVGISAGSVTAVEHEDPHAFESLEPRTLAAVLRELAIIAGTEAARRLRAAVVATGGIAQPESQVAFRTRSGRGRSDRARHEADRYVAAVLSHLAN